MKLYDIVISGSSLYTQLLKERVQLICTNHGYEFVEPTLSRVRFFSKLQLVVDNQCCVLIGGATTRLYVIAKSARHICNVLSAKKD